MSDLEHALAVRPSLRKSERKVLVQALLRHRAVRLRAERAVIQDGAGAPLGGLVTDVKACSHGDGDGHLGEPG